MKRVFVLNRKVHFRSVLVLMLCFCCNAVKVMAQYEQVWAFGNGSGLDFNNGLTPLVTSIHSNEASASVCDASGQLLFYTDGESVWNRNHNLMPNGAGLTAPGHGTLSTSQGAVIIPLSGSTDKYYICSLSDNQYGGYLSYSMVDMQQNNGLGDVDPFIKAVPLDSSLTEHMTAVAGTECNTWLLVISRRDTALLRQDTLMELKAYNIDYTGISATPVVTPVTAVFHTTYYAKWVGGIYVSPNRQKIAIAGGGLWLYDFDVNTGMAANGWEMVPWPQPATSPDWVEKMYFYAACFSADNTKLYGSTNRRIFQFDLSLGNYNAVLNSRYTVCDTTELIEYGSGLKRGPDDKIYAAHYGFPSLSVINNPDAAGAASGFVKDAIPLSGTSGVNLSNMFPVPVIDTIYNNVYQDTAACFVTGFPLQTDTAAVHLVWDNGSTQQQRDVHQTGTYWVMYSMPPCLNHRYVDTFKVLFQSLLPQVVTTAACRGDANGKAWLLRAAGDTNTYHYAWRDINNLVLSTTDTLSSMSAGYYTLEVNSSSGCSATEQVLIPEESHEVSFMADTIICAGTTVSFTNTSDLHFTGFSWYFGNQDSSHNRDPVFTYPLAGVYPVVLIGKGAICTDTAYRDIIVDAIVPGFYGTDRHKICMGEAIVFSPATDSSILSLHWQFGDGREMEGPGESTVQHAYDTPGTLPVSLYTTFRACPATAFTDTIHVEAPPKVYLGADAGLCLQGRAITLGNLEPLPPGVYRYLWNTGDTTPSITAVHPGTFSLKISKEPLGCNTTESVEVTKGCYLDIPNAFSPNGDGVNDYFFPRQWLSKDISTFSMKIWNRWGQLVFETGNPDGRGWDGNYNQKGQPGGVYIYTIDLLFANGRPEQYTGNVTLLR